MGASCSPVRPVKSVATSPRPPSAGVSRAHQPSCAYQVPPTANPPEAGEVGSATSVLQGPPGTCHLPRKWSPSCSSSPCPDAAPAEYVVCTEFSRTRHRPFSAPLAGRGAGVLGSQPPSRATGREGTRMGHSSHAQPGPELSSTATKANSGNRRSLRAAGSPP